MEITTIEYDTRASRVLEGLVSDPRSAVSMLEEFALVPFGELFEGDWEEAEEVVMLLMGWNADPGVTLCEAIAALKWSAGREGTNRWDFDVASETFISALARTEDFASASNVRSAASRGGGSGVLASPPVCFSERVKAVSGSQGRAVDQVLAMRYTAYLDAVEIATGIDNAEFRHELETKWYAKPATTVSAMLRYIANHWGEHGVYGLLENLIVIPFSCLGANLGLVEGRFIGSSANPAARRRWRNRESL